MRHLDLFSGIGGFALAVRWLGGTTVGFCEIEAYPQRVLRKNFPGVPIHDDIRTLTAAIVAGWGGCDLITGGFPCQPYSVAGDRRGDADDRALWPQMARVIDECRPTYVLAENVPGLITLALDGVLTDLEALGYSARTVGVPAVAVDAKHRRERIWIMAHAECGRRGEPLRPHPPQRALSPTIRAEGAPGIGSGRLALPHDDGRRHRAPHDEIRSGRNTTVDASWWEPEPGVGRVADGIPRRVDRLRGLGNAIVPAVAYELLSVMVDQERAA